MQDAVREGSSRHFGLWKEIHKGINLWTYGCLEQIHHIMYEFYTYDNTNLTNWQHRKKWQNQEDYILTSLITKVLAHIIHLIRMILLKILFKPQAASHSTWEGLRFNALPSVKYQNNNCIFNKETSIALHTKVYLVYIPYFLLFQNYDSYSRYSKIICVNCTTNAELPKNIKLCQLY